MLLLSRLYTNVNAANIRIKLTKLSKQYCVPHTGQKVGDQKIFCSFRSQNLSTNFQNCGAPCPSHSPPVRSLPGSLAPRSQSPPYTGVVRFQQNNGRPHRKHFKVQKPRRCSLLGLILITKRLLDIGGPLSVFILGIYRGEYPPKVLYPPKKKLVNCVRLFRLDSLLQVYRCSSFCHCCPPMHAQFRNLQ